MNDENKKRLKIKTLLGTGALALSIAPLICNGKICTPLSVPDLPAERVFIYDYLNSPAAHVASVSGVVSTATADLMHQTF